MLFVKLNLREQARLHKFRLFLVVTAMHAICTYRGEPLFYIHGVNIFNAIDACNLTPIYFMRWTH